MGPTIRPAPDHIDVPQHLVRDHPVRRHPLQLWTESPSRESGGYRPNDQHEDQRDERQEDRGGEADHILSREQEGPNDQSNNRPLRHVACELAHVTGDDQDLDKTADKSPVPYGTTVVSDSRRCAAKTSSTVRRPRDYAPRVVEMEGDHASASRPPADSAANADVFRNRARQELDFGRPEAAEGGMAAEIIYVDRFGNVVTNVPRTDAESRCPYGATVRVKVASHDFAATFLRTYARAAPGAFLLTIGSHGFLEIAANGDSAARRLGVRDRVTVSET